MKQGRDVLIRHVIAEGDFDIAESLGLIYKTSLALVISTLHDAKYALPPSSCSGNEELYVAVSVLRNDVRGVDEDVRALVKAGESERQNEGLTDVKQNPDVIEFSIRN